MFQNKSAAAQNKHSSDTNSLNWLEVNIEFDKFAVILRFEFFIQLGL